MSRKESASAERMSPRAGEPGGGWAENLRRGHPEAWRAFERRCMPRLLQVAGSLTGDPDVADDLVQRVCMSILGAEPGWCRRSVLGWGIYKLRSEVDHWRKGEARRSRRRKRASADLFRPARDPVEQLESKLVREQVSSALLTLPARRRRVWELRHLEGLTVREVAETLGISAKTVENTVLAAQKQLRATLRKGLPVAR